jgi:hypothetical protein
MGTIPSIPPVGREHWVAGVRASYAPLVSKMLGKAPAICSRMPVDMRSAIRCAIPLEFWPR